MYWALSLASALSLPPSIYGLSPHPLPLLPSLHNQLRNGGCYLRFGTHCLRCLGYQLSLDIGAITSLTVVTSFLRTRQLYYTLYRYYSYSSGLIHSSSSSSSSHTSQKALSPVTEFIPVRQTLFR